MSTKVKLDLKEVTFLNIAIKDVESDKLLKLLCEALGNINTCTRVKSDGNVRSFTYRRTEELDKRLNSDNDTEFSQAKNELEAIRNLEFLVSTGQNSGHEYNNSYYDTVHIRVDKRVTTIQKYVEDYIALNDDIKESMKTLRNKEKLSKEERDLLDRNDGLYRFLKRIQRAIKFLYPFRKLDNGTKEYLNDNRMSGDVSGLLTVTYKTLKDINPLNLNND
jgi:hypothetical protein